MRKAKVIENVKAEPTTFWTRCGAPYLYAFFWLIVVILFAYLNIIVGYLGAESEVDFFTVYAGIQKSQWSIIANVSFLCFAGIDYYTTHKKLCQWFVIILTILSVFSLICLPQLVQFFIDNGGFINIRGYKVKLTWFCYFLHGVSILDLYVLRAETRKVQIIDEYNISFERMKNRY